MGVLFPQLFQQGSPGGGGYFQRIEQTEEIAHVAHFQHPFGTQLTQRLRRQTHGLLHFRFAHFAQHFQTHLGDFLKGVALGRGAVDIFMIIVPQCLAGGGLCRLGDGEGHVRLERQQAAVQISKGDDLLRRKEAAVFLIQAVFLKPAHVVLAAARRLVQRPQGKGGALLGLQAFQTEFHVGSPCFLHVLFPHRLCPALFRSSIVRGTLPGALHCAAPSAHSFRNGSVLILLYLDKVVKCKSNGVSRSRIQFFCAFAQEHRASWFLTGKKGLPPRDLSRKQQPLLV